jgi:predicted nucleic acid-binding protein
MCKRVIISDINQNDMPRIVELTDKYADLPMDFADATLVITAEKTDIKKLSAWTKTSMFTGCPAGNKYAMYTGSAE